jgi:hypothetical protein
MVDAGAAIGVYAILKGALYFIFNKISKEKFSHRVMISGGYLINVRWICNVLVCISSIPHIFYTGCSFNR